MECRIGASDGRGVVWAGTRRKPRARRKPGARLQPAARLHPGPPQSLPSTRQTLRRVARAARASARADAPRRGDDGGASQRCRPTPVQARPMPPHGQAPKHLRLPSLRWRRRTLRPRPALHQSVYLSEPAGDARRARASAAGPGPRRQRRPAAGTGRSASAQARSGQLLAPWPPGGQRTPRAAWTCRRR